MIKDSEFWKNQSEQFDKSADYYDRFRPSYPEEIIQWIIEKTHLKSGSRILEIGAGSGKATELFVNKGLQLHCIEPGEKLAEAGRKKFASTGQVEYTTCRFEEWQDAEENFDLAMSAQAFHWVPKPLGFEKCAKALKNGGYIALFWNLYLTHNDAVDEELNKTGMFLLQPEEECEKRIQSHLEEIRTSNCFKEPTAFRFSWKKTYTSEEYIGFMKTGNQYLSASESERQAAEEKVIEIINKNGGSIERHYLCALFIAQKL